MRGYFDQRSELGRQQASLARLEAQRDSYRSQLTALSKSEVLEARARELSMVRPGERAFVVRGELAAPPPKRRPESGGDGGLFGWLTGLF